MGPTTSFNSTTSLWFWSRSAVRYWVEPKGSCRGGAQGLAMAARCFDNDTEEKMTEWALDRRGGPSPS